MIGKAFCRKHKILAGAFCFVLVLIGAYVINLSREVSTQDAFLFEESDGASKKDRSAYWFFLLRDPVANAIPKNIRAREMEHAARIAWETQFVEKTSRAEFNWFEVGPSDVGGRTRALAIDLQNHLRMIAGGVSGGLWESFNAGASWRPLKLDGENLSVTSIAQDPRPGHQNVWYYASGEFTGNSASDPNRLASYYGTGVYKSTDSGRNWTLLPAAHAGNENKFDSPFDYVSRLVVSPVTGSVFVASNAIGIFRSDDQGASFGSPPANRTFPDPVLGGNNDHYWVEVAVNSDGVILATLSSEGSDDATTFAPGVYRSDNDGLSWQNITPSTFPQKHGRSVIAFAPSNPDLAYIFSTTNNEVNEREDVRLHRLNLASGASENLSGNLPRLSEAGGFNTQAGYNMAIAVKPDDEQFVLLGGTNVYRTRDGFASSAVEREDFWIGGYDAVDDDFGNYENHHPDQHLFLFDPNDPNRLWTANDGGIYLTNDISRDGHVFWNDMNKGYNVTQFYTVAVPGRNRDPRIAGGSQDNGTPFIRMDDLTGSSRNISVGDGSHLYFGAKFAYVGFQNGSTLRLQYNSNDTPTFSGYSFIQPKSASNQIFINPFVVDPNNEDVMYYSAGASLWRNDRLGTLRGGQTDEEGLDEGWTRLSSIPFLATRNITALAVSNTPAHILYYGASDTRDDNPQPARLFRLEAADRDAGSGAVDISIPATQDTPAGSYVIDIAVNPNDAEEILVVFSNYDIVGLYHSTNGGASFHAVEGNLTGTNENPGPSLRAASILPMDGETRYFVGASTGLYTATRLNGSNTQWMPESTAEVAHAVVTDIATRHTDGLIAVATHGRGLFVGSQDENFDPRPLPESFSLAQNYPNPYATITRISYDLPERSLVHLALFDLSGRKVADLVTNADQETGRHEVVFNAASLASGTYIYQLRASPLGEASKNAAFSTSKKMMVIK